MAKPIGGRPGLRGRLMMTFGLLGAGVAGFWMGRGGPQSAAFAQPPAAPKTAPPAAAKTGQPAVAKAAAPAATPSDYSQRVVAYIYGSVPITREEFGEFLIARLGADKIDMMVNTRIIQEAGRRRGIDVTEAEIEAAIAKDCEQLKIKKAEFIKHVLQQYGVTLYEYKEDVVKPGLVMEKLCKARVKVADEELQKAFQSEYGPKVNCRIIIWPKGEDNVATREWDAIRKTEEGFDRKARSQALPNLAANGGKIMPISHFSEVYPAVETKAFSLKPGEVSKLVGTPDGTVVLKCDELIPANTAVKFEAVRDELYKKVYDKKLNQEMKSYFSVIRDTEAKPMFIFKKPLTAAEQDRQVLQEIQPTGATVPPTIKK